MNLPRTGVFTESFSISLCANDLADASLPSIVTMEASFEGDEPPVFSFTLGDIFTSLDYDFGGRGEFRRNQWRVPPFVDPAAVLTLSVTIPAGTRLAIRAFGCSSSPWRQPWTGGIRLNAHLGFWGFAPENTLAAASYAAACGYPACIVVPKATKDGELVCIHDDSINRTARDSQGRKAGDAPLYVRDFTLAELRQWEYGSFKHPIWKGEPIPLLSDFFDLCAKTGMRPMFSTHPALTRDQWDRVGEMLRARDLLHLFNIKSFDPEVLRLAHDVFGTDIEGYTLDVGDSEKANDSAIETMDSIGFDKARSRVGIELYCDSVTPGRCRAIKSAGYFVSVWALSHAPAARFREMIRMGVTEFTDDFNCSFGLDW
jgi:glycerophosphoryl diester phosphodiesterase